PERHCRVVVAAATHLGDGARDGDVLAAAQVRVPQPIGRLGNAPQLRRADREFPGRMRTGHECDPGGDQADAHGRYGVWLMAHGLWRMAHGSELGARSTGYER